MLTLVAADVRPIALLAVCLVLAGCSEAPAAAPAPQPEPDRGVMSVIGIVQDTDFQAIVGATVTVREANLTTTTDETGGFAFRDLPLAFYTVTADATDLLPQTLTARPGSNATLWFTLARFAQEPRHDAVHFQGHLQCAAEYVIIAGSCDRLLESTGQQVFDQESAFMLQLQPNWQTVVVDVVFEGDPGFDGLRVSTKAAHAPDTLGDYERYHRAHGSASFTFRIEPGIQYPGEAAPVPANSTSLLFDVFAQGHGNGAVCDPDGTCFLGLGAGIDVSFELLVTAFYVEAAPEGFTLR